MKRCPQCNRVETDEALKFCRVDGATLVNDSSSIASEAGTVQISSGSIATEIETRILCKRPSFLYGDNVKTNSNPSGHQKSANRWTVRIQT